MQPGVRLSTKTVERYRSQLEQKRSALLRRLRLEADEKVTSSADREMVFSEVEQPSCVATGTNIAGYEESNGARLRAGHVRQTLKKMRFP